MLKSVLINKSLLQLLSETNRLSDAEWDELKKMHELLNPFYELTRIISGSKYPTMGLCYSMSLKINDIIKIFKME